MRLIRFIPFQKAPPEIQQWALILLNERYAGYPWSKKCSNVPALDSRERLRAYPNISMTTTLQVLYFCKSRASGLTCLGYILAWKKIGRIHHEDMTENKWKTGRPTLLLMWVDKLHLQTGLSSFCKHFFFPPIGIFFVGNITLGVYSTRSCISKKCCSNFKVIFVLEIKQINTQVRFH